MKILLVASNFCNDPYPVYPLGLSTIAGALIAAGHEVTQCDAAIYGNIGHREELRQIIQRFTPELIGVGIRNLDNIDSCLVGEDMLKESLVVIRTLRELSTVPMVLGGSGFSLYPEEILALTGADYGIAGAGETAMVELAAALAENKPPRRGVWRRDNTRQASPHYDNSIRNHYYQETHIVPLQTKRGCAFNCVYCTYPALEGREVRPRNLTEVLADIKEIRENCPDAMLYFVDAVFNDPKRQYLTLVKAMIEHDLTMPWSAFITPTGLRDSDLELMVRAGLTTVDLGIDGGSDATLRGLGKSFTFHDVKRCCERFSKLEVGITGSVMFGGPGETYDSIAEGIANLLSLESIYVAVFSGIRMLRSTPLLKIARQEGKIPPDWNGLQALYYYASGLDPKRVDQMLREGFASSRCCIYPPGSRNDDIRMIHRFGYVKLRNLQLTRTFPKRSERQC